MEPHYAISFVNAVAKMIGHLEVSYPALVLGLGLGDRDECEGNEGDDYQGPHAEVVAAVLVGNCSDDCDPKKSGFYTKILCFAGIKYLRSA